MNLQLSRTTRLSLVVAISSCFFLAEISVGFYTGSLALIADAFHYLNDIIGFIVALVAVRVSSKKDSPRDLSFGWQRAQLLGAFFNGSFLLALGVSIFLQSIGRFVSVEKVDHPMLVMIIGSIGFALNVVSVTFLHEHDHGRDEGPPEAFELPSRRMSAAEVYDAHTGHRHGTRDAGKKGYDLGLLAVFIHILGDAANNIGVVIAGAVIWKADYAGRYYADPAVSMAIAGVILVTSIPLVKKSGTILLESAPSGADPRDVQHDLETVPGVKSVHELHVWRLNQQKSLASVHVAVADCMVSDFRKLASTINECFHGYGIHSATIQPELSRFESRGSSVQETLWGDSSSQLSCRIKCGLACEELTCCGRTTTVDA